MKSDKINRRQFAKTVAASAAFAAFAPNILSAAEDKKPKRQNPHKVDAENNPYAKNPMNIAFVGTGLMGGQNMRITLDQLKQRCVAVCDVDLDYGRKNQRKYAPDAPLFMDYREMFAKMAGKIDGVVVSTPDNSHFAIAMEALKHKIPVFVEKPLCYSIEQIRLLTQAAAKAGVPTQMGNFVHSACGIDYVREYVDAGVIGEVKEVFAWTCRPLVDVNQPPKGWKVWPKPEPIPPTLDWDKWLNTTEYNDYYSAIVPLNWRRFFKFGSGSLGDIGCHILDVPITAFGLPAPSRVKSRQRGGTSLCVPLQDCVEYYFDTSKFGKPMKISWFSGVLKPDAQGNFPAGYDKSFLPPLPKEFTDMRRDYRHLSADGMFIVGTEGVLYSPVMHLMGKPVVLPKSRAAVAKSLDKRTAGFANKNHLLNFLEGIAGDVKMCNSDFSVSGPLSEIIQLGNVTLQTGRDIVWDSKNLKCVGDPEADKFVSPKMRPEYMPKGI